MIMISIVIIIAIQLSNGIYNGTKLHIQKAP